MLDREPFAIQGNLYNALYDLRPTGNMLGMLWADAIWVDQRNLEERKRQVGLMVYIYTRASTVFIGLGHGTAEVKKTSAESGVPYDRAWTKECGDWVLKRSY
jgi:hypothetical protein